MLSKNNLKILGEIVKHRVNYTCNGVRLDVFNNRSESYRPLFQILLFAFILFAQITFSIQPAYAADDAYLKQLEAEAQNSAKLNSAKAKKSDKDRSRTKEFEHLLKFERPSTYEFYIKLKVPSREKVVESFYKEQNLSVASKKIFDLYFEQNK